MIKEGRLSKKDLSLFITRRRLKWITEYKEIMLHRYAGLPIEEQAHRIVFFEHMGILPEHSIVSRIKPNKIRIESYNFCPYLEACNRLNMDTCTVCREIGEPSIREMMKVIDPALVFSRNYRHLRPRASFCEEFIEYNSHNL